jgi:glycosyltransferase involved in cell wall biosynthesis
MKKVLIIAYHFPPDAEVGGLRPLKFAKYLPLYGWEPLILSVGEKYYPLKDPERNNSINCEVFRTKVFWSPREAYLKIKALIQFVSGKAKKSQPANGPSAGTVELMDRSGSRLRRFILSLLWLPDDRTGWIIPAVINGFKLIKKYNIKTVMTTSPPHSVQIIGLLLKKIVHFRWVADFRDPWSLQLRDEQKFLCRIQRWIEKKVISNADVILTTSEVINRDYIRAYPALFAEKFIYIPNGFDLEDFNLVRSKIDRKEGNFVISYLGEFYSGRTPEVFLRAISDLLKNGMISVEKLQLKFMGRVRYFGTKSLEDLVSELQLSSVTEITDQVRYLKAIEYMVKSSVLLIFSPQPWALTTKVFEYIASGAYIIAFTPPGALADLVNKYPRGIVVSPDDMEEAKKAVIFCYDNFLKFEGNEVRKPLETEDILRDFDRKNLTEKLSRYL